MPASTLALGQATYELLDALDGENSPSPGDLEGQSVVETVRAEQRGGVLENLDIGVREDFSFGGGAGLGNIRALNIADATQGLTFNDSDLRNGAQSSNANLNILRQADGANLGLGGGDNRLNAARELTDSQVQALGGSDTVRIGGRADNTFISLGDGDDQLLVGRSSQDLDVDTGAGDDRALFLGALKSSSNVPNSQVQINEGSSLVNLGAGDDLALFRGGIQGSPSTNPSTNGYEVQLGEGDDVAAFGRGSRNDGFVLNTGVGSDVVDLGYTTTNAVVDLGWDNGGNTSSGDTVVLGAAASLEDSVIRSGQSQDVVKLAGSVIDTSLDLGWGDSSVDVSGTVLMGSSGSLDTWDLGTGSDTLVFSSTSDISDGGSGGYVELGQGADSLGLYGSGYGVEFDLGNDNSVDVVRFADDHAYMATTISNFGTNDILWIGQGQYGYQYEFLNEFANEYALDDFRFANDVIWTQSSNDTIVMSNPDDDYGMGYGGDGDSISMSDSDSAFDSYFSDQYNQY